MTSFYRSPTDAPGGKSRFMSTFGDNAALVGVLASAIGVSCTVAAANSAIFVRIVPNFDVTVISLVWLVNGTAGNYDIGIFDDSGNRLWSKGSTVVPPSGTIVTDAVPGINLKANNIYYLGWSADNTTAAIKGVSGANLGELSKLIDGKPYLLTVDSVFPIPPTVTLGSTTINRLPFMSVRNG